MSELKRVVIPLLAWYNENKRPLPWRRDRDPYHVWISEIMLQQTRVSAVIGYYHNFLSHFPTIEALAQADEDFLMKQWQGLGYYSRARNLQKAARLLCADYGGKFPKDYASIRALPGIGDYTAGAISSIAFSIPKAAVDGNVLRVVTRITANSCDIGASATRKKITEQVEAVMPLNTPGEFNQALMELGATVCLPNGEPLCGRCPARDFCRAHLTGRTADFPVKAEKKARRIEDRQVYLIFDRGGPDRDHFPEGRVALRKRPDKGLLAGLWEFPNALEGKALPELPPLEFVGAARHIFTHIEWHMTIWAGEFSGSELPPGWVWADADALKGQYSIPSAFSAALEIALAHLREKGEG